MTVVVLKGIEILTVDRPLSVSHLSRPFQPHLGLFLSVELLFVFALLFKLLRHGFLLLFEVVVNGALLDGRLVHLLRSKVRRLLIIPLLVHLLLQCQIMLLKSPFPILILGFECAPDLFVYFLGILHLPVRLLHLLLSFGPLYLLHIAVAHGLLEFDLLSLSLLNLLHLLIALLEVDII